MNQEKQMQEYINQIKEQVHGSYELVHNSLIRQISVQNMQLEEAKTIIKNLSDRVQELEEQDMNQEVDMGDYKDAEGPDQDYPTQDVEDVNYSGVAIEERVEDVVEDNVLKDPFETM